MRRVRGVILIWFCLPIGSALFAEHQTQLRAIVDLPEAQSVLLEMNHVLAKRSNAPPVTITNFRLVRAGERFEDDTIKGHHFQLEVLEVDFDRETVRTREAGEEHAYSLSPSKRPAAAKYWLHLENVAFTEAVDLLAFLSGRVVLLHPAIEMSPVSLEAAWTNQTPEKREIADTFTKCLNQRNAALIVDGKKFFQLVPRTLTNAAATKSKTLPPGLPWLWGLTLENGDVQQLAGFYSQYSGLRYAASGSERGRIPHLKIAQPLSKPETLYAFETLLAWNNLRVVLGSDDTFNLVPLAEAPPPVAMFNRTYKMDTNTFFLRLRSCLGAKENQSDYEILKKYFEQNGVCMSPPTSVFYKDRLGWLLIRATWEDQQKIEQLVEKLQTR